MTEKLLTGTLSLNTTNQPTLWIIFILTFGTKLYRQIVGIPMGTNCAPLVADLFLFCYERDFMTCLSDVKQAEIIEALIYI